MKKLKLPFEVKKTILACGADMKGAFALAKGDIVYLFEGYGDLSDPDNFKQYEFCVKKAVKELHIKPEVVVCDMHPGYFSTKFAESQLITHNSQLITIQHHEAHIASAILDNMLKQDVLGVAFDGTGYGTDGNIWGGEFFSGSIKKFDRIYHLDYIPMPGAEMAIREPWRMAASYLYYTFGKDFLKLKINFVKHMDNKSWLVLKKMIDKSINSPLTSSMGRMFDAVSSLVLGKMNSGFEAELPMTLEKCASPGILEFYNCEDSAKIIKDIVRDIKKKEPASTISARFHNTIAYLILRIAKKSKIKSVVLSGGVFQNKFLTARAIRLLEKNGFKVYTHVNVETSDSGIPLGQIAIANERILCA